MIVHVQRFFELFPAEQWRTLCLDRAFEAAWRRRDLAECTRRADRVLGGDCPDRDRLGAIVREYEEMLRKMMEDIRLQDGAGLL